MKSLMKSMVMFFILVAGLLSIMFAGAQGISAREEQPQHQNSQHQRQHQNQGNNNQQGRQQIQHQQNMNTAKEAGSYKAGQNSNQNNAQPTIIEYNPSNPNGTSNSNNN
jgi:sortase (surface protein transpeptidase)